MDNNERFYEKQWFMWVTLIFLAPVGIFLMWKYNRFNKRPRVAISVVSALVFLVMAIPGQASNNTAETQSRSQTQVSNHVTADKQVAANLDARIVALGSTNALTLDKATEVKALRSEYNNLTSEQKNYVKNVGDLTKAEGAISNLQIAADNAAKEQAAAEQAAAEQAAAEQAAAEQAAADKAAADKAAAEQQETRSSSTIQSKNNEYTVYITETGERYHRDGCSSLSKSKIAISKSDAISQGYTSCGNCHP